MKPDFERMEERFIPDDPFGMTQVPLLGAGVSLLSANFLTPGQVLWDGWTSEREASRLPARPVAAAEGPPAPAPKTDSGRLPFLFEPPVIPVAEVAESPAKAEDKPDAKPTPPETPEASAATPAPMVTTENLMQDGLDGDWGDPLAAAPARRARLGKPQAEGALSDRKPPEAAAGGARAASPVGTGWMSSAPLSGSNVPSDAALEAELAGRGVTPVVSADVTAEPSVLDAVLPAEGRSAEVHLASPPANEPVAPQPRQPSERPRYSSGRATSPHGYGYGSPRHAYGSPGHGYGGPARNAPPVAEEDEYYDYVDDNSPLVVDARGGVLSNDHDPDGDPVTAVLVYGPHHGELALNPDDSFVYTAGPGHYGEDGYGGDGYDEDHFVYRAVDALGNESAPATVVIEFGCCSSNQPPVASPEEYEVDQGIPLVVGIPGVLGNDSDPENDPITAVLAGGPAHGTLTLNANGSFTYTPAAGFEGTDFFFYQAQDNQQNKSDPATVTLDVIAPVVTITASDPTAVEAGANPGQFTVTRDRVTTSALRVYYAARSGGMAATPGTDYATLSGFVDIPASAASATINVTPLADSDAETVAETVTLDLSPDPNYFIGSPSEATVIIYEATLALSASDPNAAEFPTSPLDKGQFQLTRNGTTASPLTINYSVGGTAKPTDDYTALSGSVTINNGAADAFFDVTPVNDGSDEGAETVQVTLTGVPASFLVTSDNATVTITDGTATSQGKKLWVLDANNAVVSAPGLVLQDFATYAVDLRAQLQNIIPSTYSWDVSQAPDATGVSGQTTYRLQFSWASFTGAPRSNVIKLTVTDTGGTAWEQTIRFLVTSTSSPAWAASRPTTFGSFSAVVRPDLLTDAQMTAGGSVYTVGLDAGDVQTAYVLPGYNPGVPPITLLYRSTAADSRPIFLHRHEISAGQPVPPKVSAKLTLNGTPAQQYYYDTSALIPGDFLQIALQADATSLNTGRYDYSIEVVDHYATPVTTTYSGQVNLVNHNASDFGAGWSLAGLQRVRAVTGGLLLELPSGLSLWFAGSGPSYTTPAGDFSTLARNGDNTYTRTLRDGTKVNFDTNGRQTSVVDRNNNTFAYTFNGSDQLESITDPNGLRTTFSYTGGKVSGIQDPALRTTTLGYTGARLTSVTSPDPDGAAGPLTSPVTGYAYDTAGRLTEITDPRNFRTTFAYNATSGRAQSAQRPDGGTQQIGPAQTFGLVAPGSGTSSSPAPPKLAADVFANATDPRSNVWHSRTDWFGFGTQLQAFNPLDQRTITYRDPNALPWVSSDPLARRTRRQFNSQGNATQVVRADDTTEAYQYNSFSQLTRSTDPNNRITTFEYDTFGNLTTLTNAKAEQTRYSYYTDGKLKEQTNARGFTTTFLYDSRDRLTETVLPDDDTIAANNPRLTYQYDAASNRTLEINERNFVTSYGYDALNRTTRTDWAWNTADQTSATFVYDPAGNLTDKTTGISVVSGSALPARAPYAYDPLGRPGGVTEAVGAAGVRTSATFYDLNGNVSRTVNARGFTTSYAYDALNRNTQTEFAWGQPEQSTSAMAYDLANNLLSISTGLSSNLAYARPATTAYKYDALNRRAEARDALGFLVTSVYDSAGNHVAVVDQRGFRTTYGYDALHRVETVRTPKNELTTTAYDQVGNVRETTNARGFRTTFLYDARNRRTETVFADDDVIAANNPRHTFVYDTAGNLQKETDRRGVTTSYGYDALNRRTQVVEVFGGSPPGLPALNHPSPLTTFVYDAAGNVLRVTNARGVTTSHAYDVLNRRTLTTEAVGVAFQQRTTAVAYDRADNVLSVTNPRGFTTTHAYDALNRRTLTIEALGVPGAQRTTATGYDAAGNVRSFTNGRGFTTAYVYDALNRRTLTVEPVGGTAPPRTSAMAYDPAGNVLAVTDPRGVVTGFAYDELNRRTQTVQVQGGSPAGLPALNHSSPVTLTAYDEVGNVRSVTDPRGVITSYAYDALNRRTAVIEALGVLLQERTTATAYDAVGNVAAVVNPRGVITSYTYDALNRRAQTIEAVNTPSGMPLLGHASPVTATFYDAVGNVVGVVNPRGVGASYVYDALNRRTQATEAATAPGGLPALGHLSPVTATAYDAADNVLSVTNPRGVTTSYAYDALNRRVLTVEAFGAPGRLPSLGHPKPVMATAYDRADNVLAVIDPRGVVTAYGYDALNRRTTTVEALGVAGTQRTTTAVYDAADNVVATVNGRGVTTGYAYDALNRRAVTVEAVNPPPGLPSLNHNSPVTTTVYDAVGNVLSVADPLNQKTTYLYDALSRRYRAEDARGGLTTTLYDAADNVTGMIDPAGNRTTMVFDALNRERERTDPLNRTMTMAYDAGSLLVSSTDRLGRRRDYAFDALGRNAVETWRAAGGALVNTLATTYDAASNRLTAADNSGAYAMTYDALDRVREQEQPFFLTLWHYYDPSGNRVLREDSFGGNTITAYDALGRMQSRQLGGVGQTPVRLDQTYTAQDQVETVRRFSDLSGTQLVGSTTFSYDALDRVANLQHRNAAGTLLANYTHTFDVGSRLGTETTNGTTKNYGYNANNELTADGAAMLNYDLAGNRNTAGYQTGPGNRMSNDGLWTYTYDFEGNRTRKSQGASLETWDYGYDHRNQMLWAEKRVGPRECSVAGCRKHGVARPETYHRPQPLARVSSWHPSNSGSSNA